MTEEEKHGPYVFEAYKSDPLAYIVLEKLHLKTWKFASIYTIASIIILGIGILVYFLRDGELNRLLLGGYHTFIVNNIFNCLVYVIGINFYVYFSKKSGTLYQKLVSNKILNQSDKEEDQLEFESVISSIKMVHNKKIWLLVAIVFAFLLFIPSAHTSWFNPNMDEMQKYQYTLDFFILPVWALGFYITGITCIRIVITIWGLRKVFKTTHVTLKPLHPDKCGGLKPLLDYALAISYLVAMFGIGLIMWSYAITQVPVDGNITTGVGRISDYPAIWIGYVAYLIMAPLTFFGTLGTSHGSMKAVKKKYLEQFSNEFDENYKSIQGLLDSETLKLQERFNRLKLIHELYQMTKAFPVWPFNMGSIRWFGTVVSSPIIAGVILLVLEVYVFS